MDYYEVLERVYEISYEFADSKKVNSALYNVINTAAVIHDIRPGALLMGIPIKHQDELNRLLDNLDIVGKGYMSFVTKQKTNFIIVRKKYIDLYDKMNKLDEIFAASQKQGNINVGKILGYYEPGNLNTIGPKKRAIGLNVEVLTPDEKVEKIRHFPQKISDEANVSVALEDYKTLLEKIRLPFGFKIQKVTTYDKLHGGKRKTRKINKKRKSLKKSRN